MKRLLASVLLSASAIVASSVSAQAGTVYLSTNRGVLGELNEATGQYTPLFSAPAFTDIALSPNGKLWGIALGRLYAIDLKSSSANFVGKLAASLNGLGFSDDGVLYGTGRSNFFEVDTNTGWATSVSNTIGFSSSGDLVFDPVRDLFWATSRSSIGDFLFTFQRDGVATRIGGIGYNNVYGLAFGDDGTLFGYTDNGIQLALNLDTGRGTAVGAISGLNGNKIWGAASDPKPASTPEPSALAGFTVLALGLGLKLRKR